MSVAEAGRTAAPSVMDAARKSLRREQIGVALLLVAASASFLWGLDRNGWANPYYSAAAQAGSQDWKAFFFGSLDAGNLVTIDKPPLSIWLMSVSVRLFGLNYWSLLVPQALMGIATTWLIYKIIRRSYPAATALLGGLIYATTPVVFLMSRFNNPEPLMGLLTVAAVYFMLKAMEDNRWRWYLLAGISLGLGFMAKQIQAFLVIPALVIAVLLLGIGTLGSRFVRLLSALSALIITGGWWIAVVDLTPAAERPYVGGSVTNSMLELTLDYNGLARFLRFGKDPESGEAVPLDASQSVYDGGPGRLFNANFAPEGAWLLFSALLCALALTLLWRQGGTSAKAKRLICSGVVWLFTVYLIVSYMGTMTHTYYIFSIAAPIAIVVPLGFDLLWKQRESLIPRLIGAVLVSGTGYIGYRIYQYSDEWGPWPTILVCMTTLATAGWLFARSAIARQLTGAFVVVAMLMSPILTNFITLTKPQSGTNPLSGPVSNSPEALSAHLEAARLGNPPLSRHLGFGIDPPVDVTRLLAASETTWAAATYTAQNAAQFQLASRRPVIALGGWLGTDPAPTLDQFKLLVGSGEIGYFIWQQPILEGVPLGKDAAAITEWVRTNFQAGDVDGVRIYDLRG